jgi:hypothetical protein
MFLYGIGVSDPQLDKFSRTPLTWVPVHPLHSPEAIPNFASLLKISDIHTTIAIMNGHARSLEHLFVVAGKTSFFTIKLCGSQCLIGRWPGTGAFSHRAECNPCQNRGAPQKVVSCLLQTRISGVVQAHHRCCRLEQKDPP